MSAYQKETNAVYNYLSSIGLFRKWTVESLEKLSANVTFEKFEDGEQIYFYGDIPVHIYIIQSGIVQDLGVSSEGEEILLNAYGKGEIFGEVGFFDGRPRETTTMAMSTTEVLKIGRADLIQALGFLNKEGWLDLANFLCSRRRQSTELLAELISGSSEKIVASIVYKLILASPQKNEIEISQEKLAVMSSMSRITVSKIINQWEAKKIIKKNRSNLKILKISALEEILHDN